MQSVPHYAFYGEPKSGYIVDRGRSMTYAGLVIILLALLATVGYDYVNSFAPQVSSAEGVDQSSGGADQANIYMTESSEGAPNIYFVDLVPLNIMGRSASDLDLDAVSALPETDLSIELFGTFTSDAEKASAVVSVDGQTAVRVYLDQEIQEGVILQKIYKDSAVISRENKLEVIKLYEPVEHSNAAWRGRAENMRYKRYPLNPTSEADLNGAK